MRYELVLDALWLRLPETVRVSASYMRKEMNAMSTEQNKQHIRNWFEALNQGTALEIIDDTYAADYVLHDPSLPEPVRGVEGIRAFMSAVVAAFPDAHYTVEDLIAEGDKVVQRCSVRGTHGGEFLGLPATGKQVAFPFMIITRFEGGKIAEEWQMLDTLGLLQQLGAIPTPEASGA
jgi:steroid delta-isomerase-like uncharacterized protein